MKVRLWILSLLLMLFFSAVGIGMFPGNLPVGSAFVSLFLGAVIGIDVTSLAVSLTSARSGGRENRGASTRPLSVRAILQENPGDVAKP